MCEMIFFSIIEKNPISHPRISHLPPHPFNLFPALQAIHVFVKVRHHNTTSSSARTNARTFESFFVVDAEADEFDILAENSLANEFTVATPVFIGGKILLRSHSSLSLVGH